MEIESKSPKVHSDIKDGSHGDHLEIFQMASQQTMDDRSRQFCQRLFFFVLFFFWGGGGFDKGREDKNTTISGQSSAHFKKKINFRDQ